MQLDYAIEGYWLAKRRDFSPNTVADYQLTFRRFGEFIGKTRDLKDITSDDVNRFLNHLRDDLGHSQKTVLNHWRETTPYVIALSSFWTWAERDLAVVHILLRRRNIVAQVSRPRCGVAFFHDRNTVAYNGGGSGELRPFGQWCFVRPSVSLVLRLRDVCPGGP